ncbi:MULTISPECIES: TetR/AcrR family transcriptional regulator C-terminal domain-containing protein [unclassified Nonomuraea]|uniref:TetR/AcrR family transcriptional regulator C-terminal domain-containing protein n=1 Tax=unclassified Nonomuraea TaxID=2593643 RepID=UPI0033C6B389
MALEKGTIVATALRLLDEGGLDKLTLRRLAGELGVQAPALYWHFGSKQDLLDAMAAQMMRERPAPPVFTDPARWRAWVAARARNDRAMLNARRDGARLAAGTRPSAELFAEVERAVAALESAGFTAEEAMLGLSAVSGYVAGFVLEEQADRARDDAEGPPDREAFARAYPRLMAALERIGDPQGDEAFEGGLALILDGLERRLASRDSAGLPGPAE